MYQMTEREYRQLVCICQGIGGAQNSGEEWPLEHLRREMDSILYDVSSRPRPSSYSWRRDHLKPEAFEMVQKIEQHKKELTECVESVIAEKPIKSQLVCTAQQILFTSMFADLPKRKTKESAKAS